jgi:hypothetical protein
VGAKAGAGAKAALPHAEGGALDVDDYAGEEEGEDEAALQREMVKVRGGAAVGFHGGHLWRKGW